jgi:hypothetical protein
LVFVQEFLVLLLQILEHVDLVSVSLKLGGKLIEYLRSVAKFFPQHFSFRLHGLRDITPNRVDDLLGHVNQSLLDCCRLQQDSSNL